MLFNLITAKSKFEKTTCYAICFFFELCQCKQKCFFDIQHWNKCDKPSAQHKLMPPTEILARFCSGWMYWCGAGGGRCTSG